MISIATFKTLYGNSNYYYFFLNFGLIISFPEAAILSYSTYQRSVSLDKGSEGSWRRVRLKGSMDRSGL